METGKIKDLLKIRGIADYQFRDEVGTLLFPDQVAIVKSRGTGRIRSVLLGKELLATLRPTDGFFSLSINGAKRLADMPSRFRLRVIVSDLVEDFVRSGRSVFAKHVLDASQEIRPYDEVIVVNSREEVLACGRALLNGEEMLQFSQGVAVRVRAGNKKDSENSKLDVPD
jgi:predicted RNA-binding protein (TIGR00451 family)